MPTKRLFEKLIDDDGNILSVDDEDNNSIHNDTTSNKKKSGTVKNNDNDATRKNSSSCDGVVERKNQEKEKNDFDVQFAKEFSPQKQPKLTTTNTTKATTATKMSLAQQEPFSIINAINQHRHRNNPTTKQLASSSSSSSSPIDIVAILLNITTHKKPQYNNNHKIDEFISFLITDPSLPPNSCCKVTYKKKNLLLAPQHQQQQSSFYSSSSLSIMDQIRVLERGDVVRFNRLSFCREYHRAGDGFDGGCGVLSSSSSSLFLAFCGKEKKEKDGTEQQQDGSRGGKKNSANDDGSTFQKNNNQQQDQYQQRQQEEHGEKLPTIICEFRQSWLDPEAGVPFARLLSYHHCRCNQSSNSYRSKNDNGNYDHHHNDNALLLLPQSMETPRSCINALCEWWQGVETSKMKHSLVVVGNGDDDGGGGDSYVGGTEKQMNDIQQQPILSINMHNKRRKCRRHLRDIQSPNLISDVLVRVLSYDFGSDSSSKLGKGAQESSSSPHQKRQCLHNRKYPASNHEDWAFVTLFDGKSGDKLGRCYGSDEDNMMAFHECSRFTSSLQRAHKDGLWVLITNVLSRHDRDGGEDIILVPTPDSSVIFMAAQELQLSSPLSPNATTSTMIHQRRKKRQSDGSTLTLTSSPSLSSPGTPHTCGDGSMQDCNSEKKEKTGRPDHTHAKHQQDTNKIISSKTNKICSPFNDIMWEDAPEVITVSSKLVDVFIDSVGVSLFAKGSKDWFSSLREFVQVLVVPTGIKTAPMTTSSNKSQEDNNNNYKSPKDSYRNDWSAAGYRNATLKLDGLSLSPSPLPCSVAKAESDIMQTLCGSVSASDLLLETHPLRLSGLVCSLLQGMIQEEVALRWTLKRSHGRSSWSVVKVMLPYLHLRT